jgi:nitrous-oxide reductase
VTRSTKAINRTTRVFCGAEFHIPHPNDGRDMDDPDQVPHPVHLHRRRTMEVRWQCRVDGNMDLVATSYNGRWPQPTSTTPKVAITTKT